MLRTLVIGGWAWLIFAALGWVALGLVRRERREALLPGAPVVGVAVLVCALHWTGLVMSVGAGLWVVLAGVVVVAVVNTVRDRRWWVVPRRALAWGLLALAAGVAPAAVLLQPAAITGDSRVVQVTTNNDAFYYVTVIDWLRENPAIDAPRIGTEPGPDVAPPSFLSAAGHINLHLRVGDELAQAAVSELTGRPPLVTWYPVTALWLVLLPAAGLLAARAFRLRAVTGVVAGVLVSIAALTVFQFAAQNSDSLLGIALCLPAVAACVAAVGRSRRFPRLLAGILFAAFVGSYCEYLPLVAPALIVAVLARHPSRIPAAVGNAAVVLGASLVAAPLAWANAVRSLLFLGGISSEGGGSAFSGVTGWGFLNRLIGATSMTGAQLPNGFGALLAAGVGAGCLAAVVLSHRRAFLLVLAGTGGAVVYYFSAVVHRPYSQQRAVEMWLPLLLFVACFGWDRLFSWSRRAPSRAWRAATALTAAVAAALGMAWTAVNIRTDQQLPWAAVRQRHVDATFTQAATWVRARGGANVLVLAGDFFDQQWITAALRDDRMVAYAELFVSYQARASYWNGRPRRWLLVDRRVMLDAPPSAVVAANARFRLVDMSRGAIVAVSAADEFYRGNYVVLRSADAATHVTLGGVVIHRWLAPLTLRRARDGAPLPPRTLVAGMRAVRLAVDGAGRDFSLNQDGLQFVPQQIVRSTGAAAD